MKKLLPALIVLALVSCGNKPSDADIKRKILMEYVCFETAKVNNLEIKDTKDAESIGGNVAYEFRVTGEVEWPEGCREFGTGVQPGAKEKFEKSVFLVKGDDGVWQ